MNTNKTDQNDRHLHAEQPVEANSTVVPLYQYFTVYLIALFLVVVAALSSVLVFISQQSTSSQALITEHLVPLQTQFLQQSYLIHTNKLIDKILHSGNVQELITFQQGLSLQSKKLSLLNSQHKSNYQQWFINNNVATNLIIRIESSHISNEVLKHKVLIQLDTLLDAIEIQLDSPQTTSRQARLLFSVEKKFISIVNILKRLSLQTPLGDFEQLRNQISFIFVEDYAKKLADSQYKSQGMADIIRDFIRFEDLILKRGLLVKWQKHLTLMGDYRQQLIAQLQQLQSILDSFSGSNKAPNPVISAYVITNKQALSAIQLPLWIFIIFALTLICVTGLLWLIRSRIKSASQSATRYIDRALDGEKNPLITNRKVSFLQLGQKEFYSTESEQLVIKIEKLKYSSYSEIEFLALTDKNKELAEKIVENNIKQEQLKFELELLEFNAMTKYNSQLLLEQQRYQGLHLAAIKQLVLLGSSAVTTTINIANESTTSREDNYLYYAHLQGRDLVRKLRQATFYRYLQSSDALLTLSDINLAGQVQAILLNLRNTLFIGKNSMLLTIDEKILSEVNVDVELFSEMFRIYIRLLLSQQIGRQISLKLLLVDKNSGQQKICFSSQVKGESKIVKLPQTLQGFNDDGTEQNELGDYFITLLQYQHGNDARAKLTDEGYCFSFTLPLAINSNQQQKSYSELLLPRNLAEIDDVCVKLAVDYLAMPIEVLLAVKAPQQYQRLQQLLQGLGLQVTFVSCERMLVKNWQSGRFAVLMTEINCQPFCSFIIDEREIAFDKIALGRGVFNLANVTAMATKPDKYSDWDVGELNAKSTVTELITAMGPWIRAKKNDLLLSEKPAIYNANKGIIHRETLVVHSAESFNFQRYIKNQGSAELAIFMLEEYTSENILLVDQLSHAFANNNAKKVDMVIQALLINSKILAADNLLELCQYWQKLLTTHGLDNSEKMQVSLLSRTQQVVQDINQHADAVV